MPGRIYLDHSATTPLLPRVVEEMNDFLVNHFGNPSSMHSFGRDARDHLKTARQNVAQLINAPSDTIYFSGSGTEANNIAILGLARALGRGHIITSAAEHPASLRACEHLLKEGFDLTVVEVDGQGVVHPETVHKALRKDTILVSMMLANNEVGSINPIREIAEQLKGSQALFHVDAIQAAGKIRVDVEDLSCDLLSLSAHKINGPKGVAALYKRREIPLEGLIYGGGQEQRLRSGTENMPGIWGMGVAARLAAENWQSNAAKWQELRDHFISRVMKEIPHSYLNGHPDKRLPHNANFSFDNIEGEALLLHLDLSGIACSAGSACASGSAGPSHVLEAMGLSQSRIQSAIRFTLGHGNTLEEIDYTVEVLKQKCGLLRSMIPNL